jgi:hypothetical protein
MRRPVQRFMELVEVGTLQTPIMIENPPDLARSTRVFERGSWLSPYRGGASPEFLKS